VTLRHVTPPPPGRLLPWIERFAGLRAVVWGDFVLDEYWRCQTRRVSREAPVLVLDWESRSVQGGGAANAALNLQALGAEVSVVGVVGDDDAGRELRAVLERAGADTGGLLVQRRLSTIVKTRIVAGGAHTARQQVVRVDRGTPFRGSARDRSRVLDQVRERVADARALVLSDYGYDAVSPELARGIVAPARRRGVVVGLDARYRLAAYRGVTLATPNEGEAADAAGVPIAGLDDLTEAAMRLLRRTRTEHLLVTRGRDGLTLWNDRRGESLAAWGGEEAVDVTGAGDAVVAAATLALAAGAPPRAAAALANVAGSVAVSRRGAVAVSAAELRRALADGAPARPARGRTRRRR
jgi:rfaE bifunctional protein kinase chain/domain